LGFTGEQVDDLTVEVVDAVMAHVTPTVVIDRF